LAFDRDTIPITVTLRSAAQQLAERAEARMHSHNGGYFIDETQMHKSENSTMADAFNGRIAGLISVPGPRGETLFVSSRHPCKNLLVGCGTMNCFIRVYLDGVLSPVNPDFSRMWPGDFAIAEFYPGGASVPAAFGGLDVGCGVLLLWSRER
jgi:hypothetical protein